MNTSQDYIEKLDDHTFKIATNHYILNQIHGKSMREIARSSGCHPSTVMRHVHKIGQHKKHPKVVRYIKNATCLGYQTMPKPHKDLAHAVKLLRQRDTLLAVSQDMPRAVIFGQDADGNLHKLDVVTVDLAHALVIQGDLRVVSRGKVVQYVHIHQDQPPSWVDDHGLGAPVSVLPVQGEGPLENLSRRRGADGQPFLSRDLVLAGRRLTEDFILSGCQSAIEERFEQILLGHFDPVEDACDRAALRRFQAALRDLGPGLSDIAVRSCCFQEGIERSESVMGWSARSGKIVLRIALQRLRRHYDTVRAAGGGQIG